jgi:hypothetical protein
VCAVICAATTRLASAISMVDGQNDVLTVGNEILQGLHDSNKIPIL